jgi:hypothetical protein
MAANLKAGPLLEAGRSAAASLAENCRTYLSAAQNDDGGWGFHPNSSSSVESTSWALIALLNRPAPENFARIVPVARNWLRRAQLPDGSWPAFAGQRQGCWVTSMASLALYQAGDAEDAVAKGRKWLCNSWPRDGSAWMRGVRWLLSADRSTSYNSSLRGWGWTPSTSSWIEPTASALLFLQTQSGMGSQAEGKRRKRLGEAMLLHRICHGGGWNCGNPAVYGVQSEPQIGPTSMALLALKKYLDREEVQLSLRWLEGNLRRSQSPASLALGVLCLKTYGREWEDLAATLLEAYARNQALSNTLVHAWILLALDCGNNGMDWNARRVQEK